MLQWLGDSSLHSALAGRLLLVHLLCKHEARRIQEPCLAIRVAGAQGAPQPGHQGEWAVELSTNLHSTQRRPLLHI